MRDAVLSSAIMQFFLPRLALSSFHSFAGWKSASVWKVAIPPYRRSPVGNFASGDAAINVVAVRIESTISRECRRECEVCASEKLKSDSDKRRRRLRRPIRAGRNTGLMERCKLPRYWSFAMFFRESITVWKFKIKVLSIGQIPRGALFFLETFSIRKWIVEREKVKKKVIFTHPRGNYNCTEFKQRKREKEKEREKRGFEWSRD